MRKIYKLLAFAVLPMFSFSNVKAEMTVTESVMYESELELYNYKAARTSDGYVYVSWVAYGGIPRHGYNLYIQRYSPDGEKLFGENGLVLDTHASPSWMADNSLVVDSEGNAYVSWADSRHEENEGVENFYEMFPVIYKVSPSGESLWGGTEGLEMGGEEEYSYPPILYMLNDNLYASLIAFNEWDPASLVRLNLTDGSFACNPIQKTGQLIESEGADFIIVYAGAEGTEAMRYTKDMSPVWNNPALVSTNIYGGYGRFPYDLVSDGMGGVVVSFERQVGLWYHMPIVQYIKSNGEAVFGEAVDVIDTEMYEHDYCVIGVNTETEEIMAAWSISGGKTAVGGQLLDYFGDRLWGDEGVILQEKESLSGYGYGTIVVWPLPESKWLVLYADEIGWANNQLYLSCVDENGEEEWLLPLGEPQDVSYPKFYFENGNLYLYYKNEFTDDDWNTTYYVRLITVKGIIDIESGVNDITVKNDKPEFYSIDGVKSNHPVKGINIIKEKDGSVRKVYVK